MTSSETAKERRTRRRMEKMQERKRRQKELFDSMYDDENPGKKNHFETLKDEMAQQAQVYWHFDLLLMT